tara:strand:+ start:139 stop:399 length:261 start_codon:yes stop_codon:yes gene_type:complete
MSDTVLKLSKQRHKILEKSARKVDILLTIPMEEAIAMATLLEVLIESASGSEPLEFWKSDEQVVEICNSVLKFLDKAEVKVSEVSQ